MKTKIKDNYTRRGFSLLEILAVLVVISMLIGLLVPALSTVKKMAANVRQKAQFTTIEAGLEAFNTDFGDYPDSGRLSGTSASLILQYCGAQKLAEAMVGLDGFGFHKDSVFGHDRLDYYGNPIYVTPVDLSKRKGPYLELEVANAVSLKNLYPLKSSQLLDDYNSFVLSDKFGLLKNAATAKKAGKPILYFRANTNKTLLWEVYNFNDNLSMVQLDGSHPMEAAPDINFFAKITNPNFTVTKRPYRAESFILMSAGADGLYGTADDVFNFDTE